MSDATKPVLTWVRLAVGVGILLFGLTASLDSVSTTDTPPRHCNGTAIEVAFTGGSGSADLRDACRGEGRGQAEAGLFVSAIGVIVLGWRRARRWARARDQREPGVTIWRRDAPLRPFAVITVWSLIFLVLAASGWDIGTWIVGLLLLSPVLVPLWLFLIRPRIEVRPDRLIVRNAIGRRELPWADVTGAEATRGGIVVTLRSGGHVRAAAVRAPRRTREGAPSRADQVVALVRARSKQAGGSAGLVFGWGAVADPPPPPPWRPGGG